MVARSSISLRSSRTAAPSCMRPRLTPRVTSGVALLGGESPSGRVTFAFTGRSGGVSQGPWSSLNLGDRCGDELEAVAENRRRVLAALDSEASLSRLVCPCQVHGTQIVVVSDGSDEAVAVAQAQAQAGADAVVCSAPGVPVLLCYADCVPVVLVAECGFAVVHSGWRGTLARIAGLALKELCSQTDCKASSVACYIGPHITAADYEVSPELLDQFVAEFGRAVDAGECKLDLSCAVRRALVDAGASDELIVDCGISTFQEREEYYSFRASGGTCGRHGALAILREPIPSLEP